MNLSPDLARTAAQELGETTQHRDDCLVRIKEELLKLPEDARPSRMDDDYIIRFLRSRKFDVTRALAVILNRQRFQKQNPHIVKDLHAEEFRELYKQGFLRLLSCYDQQGRLIAILLPARLDAIADANTIMRWVVWVTDAMADDPHMQVNGVVLVQDFGGYSLRRHMQVSSMWSTTQLRSIFHFIQRCAPYRLGAVHVVNQPAFMSFLWAVLRPFMKKKVRQRIHFHGTRLYGLLDALSPQMLPPELGGTLEEDPMAWFEEAADRERVARAASAELELSGDAVRSQAVMAGLGHHADARATALEAAAAAPRGYPQVRPPGHAAPSAVATSAPVPPFQIADADDSEDIEVYPAVAPVGLGTIPKVAAAAPDTTQEPVRSGAALARAGEPGKGMAGSTADAADAFKPATSPGKNGGFAEPAAAEVVANGKHEAAPSSA